MTLAVCLSRAQAGMDAPLVTVEVQLANGLPGLSIVGLPEAAVKESKDRVRGALQSSHFDFPARRITVNLAPADLPKDGGRFDLPIALGILAASGQLPAEALAGYEFVGELALSGALRPLRGALPVALAAREAGHTLIVPDDNGPEAALVNGGRVFAGAHLLSVCAHLRGEAALPRPRPPTPGTRPDEADLADVRGQHQARRALEVAAAGGHSLLFIGPPGTGKTLLASRLPGILPPMSEAEAVESAALQSLTADGLDPTDWRRRPFRAPHHTASAVALVGGGSQPRPGEISLAHHGVLFLDELPEFDRKVLEVLREPLESGRIVISRAARQATYPARFQLVAAMNPCPCGYLGDRRRACRCTPDQMRRYRSRLSGPLLDRIDLHVPVERPDPLELDMAAPGEPSAAVRQRVVAARDRQTARQGCTNARLEGRALEARCALGDGERRLLAQAMERLQLSLRARARILRVARTLADLDDAPAIAAPHLAEAIAHRPLDRAQS